MFNLATKVSTLRKLLISLAILFLAACGGKKVSSSGECIFPEDKGKLAPTWICGAFTEGVAISAVGYAVKSDEGINNMYKRASSQAREFLAQKIQADIKTIITTFVETIDATDKDKISPKTKPTEVYIGSHLLGHAKVYKQMISPSGDLYVLLGFDAAAYAAFIEDNINQNFNIDKEKLQKKNIS
ncbi:hypothetical protein ABSA28_00113 [Candidatus Hepatincolaceae symbiont of Richtersius coronifer]